MLSLYSPLTMNKLTSHSIANQCSINFLIIASLPIKLCLKFLTQDKYNNPITKNTRYLLPLNLICNTLSLLLLSMNLITIQAKPPPKRRIT